LVGEFDKGSKHGRGTMKVYKMRDEILSEIHHTPNLYLSLYSSSPFLKVFSHLLFIFWILSSKYFGGIR